MAISLDHEKARKILFAEAEAAKSDSQTQRVKDWELRVKRLGDLCPHGKSSTTIAALGTAILAKATNSRVDIYSLLDRGDLPNSYSARSLVDGVWAKNRGMLGVDLGANGTNPLNNTPFIGKKHIDDISGVRNAEGWNYFLDCMSALKQLASSEEASEALRGFIRARTQNVLTPIAINPQAGDNLTPNVLIAEIDRYVAEDSEGGRRAQACAAALLDVAFGSENVDAGVINDPSRVAPLDVAVKEDGVFFYALEVKDKPIEAHHVIASVEKAVKEHGLKNLNFLAVSRAQSQKDFDAIYQWASRFGVKITIFLSWQQFYLACRSFSPATDSVYDGQVFRRLLQRGDEVGVDRQRLERLAAVGRNADAQKT